MRKITILIFILLTILILYAGLWDELANRVRFNKWDIIGTKGRVTNYNLYSNLYLCVVLLFLMFHLFDVTRKRYFKSK